MKINRLKYIIISTAFLYSSLLIGQSAVQFNKSVVSPDIGKYRLFEVLLNASGSQANPYTDVHLSAQFYGPVGEQVQVEGFWYGDQVWRIRFMPTSIGRWTFVTSSDDSAMSDISGEFNCVPSEHPGILLVNPDHPYTFMLSEGSPFFWMGETAWYLMSNEISYADGTFQTYVDQRARQKFNNIHFVLGTGGLPYGTKNPENEGGPLWISQIEGRINPRFFEWMDKRIAYLDSVNMAFGFFITWSQHMKTFSKEEYERFERYLIARYAAYPLLYWVVVGEFDEVKLNKEYIYHGTVINDRDPYGHLITIQPGHSDPENVGTNRIFANETWLDIIMLQLPYHYSGQIYTVSDVYDYVLTDRIYDKPVVDVEFGYEDFIYPGTTITGDDVRKFAWAIVMAGGFPSYGHHGIAKDFDLSSVYSEGAQFMTHLFDFFSDLHWWEMYPANEKVDRGFCLQSLTSEYIVYLSDDDFVTVDLTGENTAFQCQWYDPKNGSTVHAAPVAGGMQNTFIAPFVEDAVLYLSPWMQPIIRTNADSLRFTSIEGEQDPPEQQVLIENAGQGILQWSATETPNQSWLSLTNRTGLTGDALIVSVSSEGLAPGRYGSSIEISDSQAVNNPLFIPVSFILDPGKAELSVTPASLNFSVSRERLELMIRNEGGDTLNWSVRLDSIPLWIVSIEPLRGKLSSGQTQLVTLTVSRSGLEPRVHHGLLLIDANTDTTSIPVQMEVLRPPVLSLSSQILDFDSTWTSKLVFISNSGDSVLQWRAVNDSSASWIISINPDTGILLSGEQIPVNVSVYRTGVEPSALNGSISVLSTGGEESISVYMAIGQKVHFQHRVNCGSDATYLDTNGGQWEMDRAYENDFWGYIGGGTYSTKDEITNTVEDALYQSERFGCEGYDFKVDSGNYQVALHFAEIYMNAPGKRTFDVLIEDVPVLTSFDIYSEAGRNAAIVKSFDLPVMDGLLSIRFNRILEDPKVSAIEVIGRRFTSTGHRDLLTGHLPIHSRLHQNYPNPFNPSTVIAFDLPVDGEVILEIFNVNGQLIDRPLNSRLRSGQYRIEWATQTSGIYFCRLSVITPSARRVEIKKMLMTP